MMQFIVDNAKLIGYAIATFSMLQIVLFVFFSRKHIFPDLRGRDKMWQFIELSGVVWIFVFPAMVISSAFGIDYPSGAWSTMDIVYFINILGRNANRLIEARFGIPPAEEKKEQ